MAVQNSSLVVVPPELSAFAVTVGMSVEVVRELVALHERLWVRYYEALEEVARCRQLDGMAGSAVGSQVGVLSGVALRARNHQEKVARATSSVASRVSSWRKPMQSISRVSSQSSLVTGVKQEIETDFAEKESKIAELGPGYCYLRGVPLDCFAEAEATLGADPGFSAFMALPVRMVEAYHVLERLWATFDGVAIHVLPYGQRGVVKLSTLCRSFRGRCGGFSQLMDQYGPCTATFVNDPGCVIGSSEGRKAHVPREVGDVSVKCACAAFAGIPPKFTEMPEPLPEGRVRDHRALSRFTNEAGINVYFRRALRAPFMFRCEPLDLRGKEAFSFAKVHGTGGSGGVMVEGDFVQVYLRPQVEVTMHDAEYKFGPYDVPMVISAERVLAFTINKSPGWVVVRNRMPSARRRWFDLSLRVNPTESFARFWTLVDDEAPCVFSVPSCGGVASANVTYRGIRSSGIGESFGLGNGKVAPRGNGFSIEFPFADGKVAGVTLEREKQLVFGPHVHDVAISGISSDAAEEIAWNVQSAEDDYALDDGGPSDEEGFLAEF